MPCPLLRQHFAAVTEADSEMIRPTVMLAEGDLIRPSGHLPKGEG